MVETNFVSMEAVGGDGSNEGKNNNEDDASDCADDMSHDSDNDQNKEAVWDEGGPSDCGYNVHVHETFMNVGYMVHKLVSGGGEEGGQPSEETRKLQTTVSNWFQELSYATRDLWRGEKHLATDARCAVDQLFTGGGGDGGDDGDEDPADGAADDTTHEHDDDPVRVNATAPAPNGGILQKVTERSSQESGQ